MPKQGTTDVYMQFAAMRFVWPAVSTVLTETQYPTGMSIRGGLAWLIHVVEFWTRFPSITANRQSVALSSQRGRATIPVPDSQGVIAYIRKTFDVLAGGSMALDHDPRQIKYLPPVPFAGANLSLYGVCTVDDAALDGTICYCRIGFTTVPVDGKLYAELAEVWAQV